MGATEVNAFPGLRNYDARRYQSTHVQGGTILGSSPESSVVNTYGQHWQAANLFVLGASLFPTAGGANPTPTIFALTYRTADAVAGWFVKMPGPPLLVRREHLWRRPELWQPVGAPPGKP